MGYAEMTPAMAKQLNISVVKALDSNALSRFVRRVWVFQKQCLVVDFAYKQVHFGFNFMQSHDGKLSVELVQRGKQQPAFSVTEDGKKKNALVLDVAPDDAIAKTVAKISDLISRIDVYRAGEAERSTQDTSARIHERANVRKVGVLTLPLSKNYGGNLQAYALMQTLRDLGCDPVLINRRYAGTGRGKAGTSGNMQEGTSPITNKINIESVCDNRSFIEKNILPITRVFRTSAQLRKHIADYDFDAVIAGSDQVWRPKYARGLLLDYFHEYLADEKDSIRRISYAASFGASNWEYSDEQAQRAAHLIKQFDAVSVREDAAVDLCREHLGVKAKHVLDPTLLLTPERYRQLFSDRITTMPGRRITSYILDPNPEKLHLMRSISDRLSMKIFSASGQSAISDSAARDKSVEGWLSAFYQADFIFTDSFHGVAFSILFNKPFIAFANPQRGIARFTSILKMFGLEDRLVADASQADMGQLLQPIDWIAVNLRLDRLRQNSIAFLRDALGLSPDDKPKPPKSGRKPRTDPARTAAGPLESAGKKIAAKSTRTSSGNSTNPLNVLCTGCGVCVSESQGGLAMAWNKDGFLAPRATDKSIPAKTVRVCPFNPAPEAVVRDEDALGRIFHAGAAKSHPQGGYFENSYIGYSNEFRPTSSSGGLATYVFDQLLRRKELDYLFVVGGDAEHGYRYQILRDGNDIKSISKTRYFPVTMAELFSIIEQTKGRVGVSGVACFIKAIRLKQHYHPELREKIPFLVGIICGGLKSRYYTDFLAGSAGIKGDYRQPQYRVKNPEGEANDYFFSARDAKLTSHKVRMRRLGDMWGSGLFKNKACDFCTDVLTELADISLGDAWIPEYNRDGMGNSVVVTRSPLAERIIREGIAAGDLTMKEAPITLVVRSQSGGVNHKLNALKFRLWMSRNFSGLTIPECRTRVEKEVSAADMLVQVLRERVRSNSLRFWQECDDLHRFNRRMRGARSLLQAVTAVRKKQPDAVYNTLLSALIPMQANGHKKNEVAEIQPLLRWMKRKLFTQELSLTDLEPLLPEMQKLGSAIRTAENA